ncbi:PAS domain S-box protein [Geobacter sulfurreducens]|uniref:hybrid sensor histidine kinase/response regulator n=1 Tax=Geobacter sulfurreducens TaxID=35554 RepID=UPI001BDD6682|nr:PAS domain S-box protein [Geobacter sulfurreducens]QVW34630.1 PAS domain S-box protein [Geobacter sulfurreducens]
MKLIRQLLSAAALTVTIGVVTYFAVTRYVVHKAEENLKSIILSHRSFHAYIQQVMHPTYYKAKDEGKIARDFYAPQLLSSSYMTRVMHGLFNKEREKEGFPLVYYKMASQNPRNPVNIADEREAYLLGLFNTRRDLKSHSEIRTIDGKKYLLYAKPFLETNQACLRCHGNRADSPIGLQQIYSGQGGFNESAGTIRAIESIRIPLDDEFTAAFVATTASLTAAVILAGLFFFNTRLRQRVRQSTEALAESEENYRHFTTLTSDYVHKCSRKGKEPYRIKWIGGALNAISGYSSEEMFARGCWLSIVHPDDKHPTAEALASLKPGDIRDISFRIIAKDESIRWITDSCQCEQGATEDELILYGAASDTTDRKKAEALLHLTRASVNAVSDAIFWITPDARFVDVNEAACRTLGYSREELLNRGVFDVDPDSPPEVWAQHFPELRRQGTLRFESRHRTKDGRIIPVEIVANYIRHDNDEFNCAVVRDITERKRAEEEHESLEKQLLHAQKLESLGVLAGGIAHDFNNILTAIVGNTDLALMRLNPESPVRDNLARIERAANRASDLAKQMLAYSGKGKFVIEPIDLNRLVEEMTHMLQVSISKKAVLRFNFADSLPTVDADATQLRQIIMNLVINASEAIADKSGVIAISTGCMQCDRKYLSNAWLNESIPEGLYVWLEVADTGCGMDRETVSKIFDPFFTTKFTGRGLGMAAVLGIVRGHKGAIRVYSEPGRGTTFKVLLPAGDKPKDLFNGDQQKQAVWKGCGTVLLVDDEETVIGIGAEMLKELGFDVLTAMDGREALEVFAQHQEKICCIILDLTMPHLDGEQTFRELRQLKPDVKVIMSSGYNEQEINQRFAGKGLAGFIQKPYRLSMLKETIRNVQQD